MPHQARGYPPGVQVRLLPFGEAALQHFVYLERPEGMEGADAEGFPPAGPPPSPMSPEEIIPRGQDFATVGHLYRSIERGLGHLADKLGADRLFIGPAFQQADETTFGWPDLLPITDLAGASRAIERIVEQGEGARGDWATAHYGRFLAVLEDYRAMREADPGFEPAHPVAAAAVQRRGGDRAGCLHLRSGHRRCSDLFNAVYELILQMIARYFAFGHETPGQRQVLAHAAVGLMFQAIKPLGLLLAAPAGRRRSSRGHGGSQLPAPLPGQLPAPAPPLCLAPLRRAPRRTGRLRRGPPPAGGSRRGGGGVIGARPDGFPPDGLRRDRVRALPLSARAAKANHYYGVLLS